MLCVWPPRTSRKRSHDAQVEGVEAAVRVQKPQRIHVKDASI
jgi:hypothetical protein